MGPILSAPAPETGYRFERDDEILKCGGCRGEEGLHRRKLTCQHPVCIKCLQTVEIVFCWHCNWLTPTKYAMPIDKDDLERLKLGLVVAKESTVNSILPCAGYEKAEAYRLELEALKQEFDDMRPRSNAQVKKMREELNVSRARVAELEEKNRSSEELLKELSERIMRLSNGGSTAPIPRFITDNVRVFIQTDILVQKQMKKIANLEQAVTRANWTIDEEAEKNASLRARLAAYEGKGSVTVEQIKPSSDRQPTKQPTLPAGVNAQSAKLSTQVATAQTIGMLRDTVQFLKRRNGTLTARCQRKGAYQPGPTITQEVDLLHSKQLEVAELQKQLATVHAELELRRKNTHQTEQRQLAGELKTLKEKTAVQTLAEEPDILNAVAPSDPLPSASVKVETLNDAPQRAELKNTELCDAKEQALSANLERSQALEGSKTRLSKEVVVLGESVVQYTRTMIRITNIPMDYTQEDVIRQWLGNGKHLIHWDESPDMFMRLHENDTQSCIAYLANEQAALELQSCFQGIEIFGKKLRFEVETLKKTVDSEPNMTAA